MTIKSRAKQLMETVHTLTASACPPHETTLICVSKYHSVEEAKEVYQAGVRHFAENYVQGLLEKKEAMADDIVWHLIGPLQSRKVKDIINHIDYFHALDRLKIAKEINKRADQPIACFVEVNVSGEESKHGIKEEEVIDFIKSLADYPKVKVVGLMTMLPQGVDVSEQHRLFGQLRKRRDQVAEEHLPWAPCTHLSMGMSGDYQIAIEEGASFVRVGSAFFQ